MSILHKSVHTFLLFRPDKLGEFNPAVSTTLETHSRNIDFTCEIIVTRNV